MRLSPRRQRAADLVAHGVIRPDRACKAKVAYPTQNDARHAAKVLAKAHERAYDTYRCPWDRTHYHITKRPHGEETE
jgi:hypothetical protein